MNQVDSTIRVLVASPLEPEHIAAIREELPSHVELMYDPSLLPTPRYVADHNGPADFVRTADQARRWNEMASRAHVAFDFPYTNRHPHEYAPQLQWVQTTSAGVGQLASRLGIRQGELTITTASGVHARPLTEFVFMVLLMGVKRYPRIAEYQKNHTWERFAADELSGKTLAIIGPGKIGQEVSRIGRCFDMKPVALARDSRPERAGLLGVDRLFSVAELSDMLAQADALVVCAPHTVETENLLDRRAFGALKPGVILVNIGRGQLVDEEAMLEKLRDGTISLAGLDVFRTEPLPPGSPFWDLPNVIVNPHSASTSLHENERIVHIFRHNLACFLDGRLEEMQNVLDIERMY